MFYVATWRQRVLPGTPHRHHLRPNACEMRLVAPNRSTVQTYHCLMWYSGISRYKDTQYMLALHDKQTRAHASPAAAMLPGPLQRLTTLPPRLVVSLRRQRVSSVLQCSSPLAPKWMYLSAACRRNFEDKSEHRRLRPVRAGRPVYVWYVHAVRHVRAGRPACVCETAKGADVLTAVLEAAYIRQAVTEHVRLKQAPETAATTSTGRRPGHSNSSHSSSGSRNVQASSSLQARQDRINDPLSGEQGEGGSCGGIQSRGRSASSKSGCSGNNTAVQQQQPLQQQQQQQQQEAEARARAQAAAAAQLRYGFPLSEKELESLALGAHRRATRDAKRFVKEVSAAGWKVRCLGVYLFLLILVSLGIGSHGLLGL
eukprot:1147907-Pelagomonas_calceolata.AAC.7